MAMVLLTPKSFFAQYAWFSRGRSHLQLIVHGARQQLLDPGLNGAEQLRHLHLNANSSVVCHEAGHDNRNCAKK